MERDGLGDAVALVEDTHHRDPLWHGGHRLLSGRLRTLAGRRDRCVLLLAALAAGSERERDQQRCGKILHAYSGIQGS
jgi:hypothetical protein